MERYRTMMRHGPITAAGFTGMVVACAAAVAAAPPKVDWLAPSGAGPGTTVVVTASDAGSWLNAWIDDPQGVTIKPHADKGKLWVTTAADVKPGVRWIRVHNDEGAAALRPFIIGTLPEIAETEPNDTAEKAHRLETKVVVNGVLEKRDDVDVFRVKLGRGQTLIASMVANTLLTSPMDAVLEVCDASGFVLAQNHDTHGLDPQIVFEAARDGEYLVRTFAFPSAPDSSINFAGAPTYHYRLTLTTGAFLDHTLPLSVPRDKPGEVLLFGWNLPAELARRTLTADALSDIAAVHAPALANTLNVRAISASIITATDHASPASPQPVTPPVAISGQISAKDGRKGHAFRFPAKKGQTLRLRAESTSLGYALDPVLRITDAAGKELSEADDAKGLEQRDPVVEFKPAADGDYIVSIRDLNGRGGFRFVYQLTIEEPRPDFAVTLDKDSFTASAGKTAEVPVTIDRRHGFAEEISLRIDGLPEGFKAAPVVSRNGDASAKAAKIVVTVPAAPGGFSFTVSAESGSLRRTATFTVGDGMTHASAWLTVRK